MHPIVAFLGGIGLLILLMGRASGSSTPARPALPPAVPPPPDDDAVEREETEKDIQKEVERMESTLPSSFDSPIKGVSKQAWTQYVKSQKSGKLNTVTKSNHLGLFLMGYRMLQDLGYVKNARKVAKDGRTVWTGDFVPPLTLERFLSDAMLQYEAFAKMSAMHARAIQAKYGDVIKGSNITLSGLLAVAKFAGLGGLNAWMTDQAKRKPETTAEFNRANGIF